MADFGCESTKPSLTHRKKNFTSVYESLQNINNILYSSWQWWQQLLRFMSRLQTTHPGYSGQIHHSLVDACIQTHMRFPSASCKWMLLASAGFELPAVNYTGICECLFSRAAAWSLCVIYVTSKEFHSINMKVSVMHIAGLIQGHHTTAFFWTHSCSYSA